MAQEYVSLLKTSGKFKKTISYKGKSYKSKITKLSASSINEYITQIKQIFRIMAKTGGLIESPFDDIKKLSKQAKKRDVFEIHELEIIHKYLNKDRMILVDAEDKISRDEFLFIKAVFTIGINTGLSKGIYVY